VIDLDPDRNTVSVGEAADLERGRLVATSVNFIACAAADLAAARRGEDSPQPSAGGRASARARRDTPRSYSTPRSAP